MSGDRGGQASGPSVPIRECCIQIVAENPSSMWWSTILLEDYGGLEILHLRHYKLLKHVQIRDCISFLNHKSFIPMRLLLYYEQFKNHYKKFVELFLRALIYTLRPI
jgi:hypothetical protein